MKYRRSKTEGGTFFFTVVPHNRRRFLCEESRVALLRDAFRYVINKHPFSIDAFVLLPEHLHCIWTLPENDNDFSMRWRLIKNYFSKKCKNELRGLKEGDCPGRSAQTVWQHRFWEHQSRNNDDFIRHVEYIHYNPVKHGLANSPKAWPHSTFHRFVEQGVSHADWGADQAIIFQDNIGRE